MKKIEIKGTLRTEFGKKATKKLRKEKLVPCEIYGGKENIHFYAHENEFRHFIYSPDVFVVEIDIDGKIYPTIVQEYQFHPVKDNVIHIDFIEIDENQPIKVAMPVKLEGLAIGVQNGGKLILNRRKLRVLGLVKDIPEQLIIDVAKLTIGKSIMVGELNFDNLTLIGPKDEIVCGVRVTRVAVVEEDAEGVEGEEGTEGEEGAEKPAEGGDDAKAETKE